jgi:hypothetical protein
VDGRPKFVAVDISDASKLGPWICWRDQWDTRIFDDLNRETKEARNSNLDVLKEPRLF